MQWGGRWDKFWCCKGLFDEKPYAGRSFNGRTTRSQCVDGGSIPLLSTRMRAPKWRQNHFGAFAFLPTCPTSDCGSSKNQGVFWPAGKTLAMILHLSVGELAVVGEAGLGDFGNGGIVPSPVAWANCNITPLAGSYGNPWSGVVGADPDFCHVGWRIDLEPADDTLGQGEVLLWVSGQGTMVMIAEGSRYRWCRSRFRGSRRLRGAHCRRFFQRRGRSDCVRRRCRRRRGERASLWNN